MTRVIRLRKEAERDILEATTWYERQRENLGHQFLDALEATFSRIAENPLRFPMLHRGIRRALLSRFPFGVFFLVEPEALHVLGVLHASRHPTRWRERI